MAKQLSLNNIINPCFPIKKSILIILAPGFEEIEAITPIDILRRANIEVVIASFNDEKLVAGRNDLVIQTNVKLGEILDSDFDAIIIPGGPAATLLKNDERVLQLVKELHKKQCIIAAICAGPTVLLDAGILEGKEYTAHFSTKNDLPDIQDKSVVVDKNIITSQGPGTALPFAFKIVEVLLGKEIANQIKEAICYPNRPH